MSTLNKSFDLSKKIRIHALKMVHISKSSHIGSCLSMADLLAVLYNQILCIRPTEPNWPYRDRFILSKGHGSAILYAVLAECRFFPIQLLDSYCQDDTQLSGHVTKNLIPGIEVSSGSLGHGLPIACGMALKAKRLGEKHRIFVLLGDGELNEGSNWESALFAPQHDLDNLIVIIDHNQIQSFGATKDIIDLSSIQKKFSSFRWSTLEIDGHNLLDIYEALSLLPLEVGKPNLIVANTIKGKGVSFMEDQLAWHYKSPDKFQLNEAIQELMANENNFY